MHSNVFLLNKIARPLKNVTAKLAVSAGCCSKSAALWSALIRYGPTMRPMNAPQEPRAGPGFQLNKDSLSVRRRLLRSSWRCTGVELVRADSRHSEGGMNVSIGGQVTSKEILQSGCRLLWYWRRRPKDRLGAPGYRTVHRLERRELSNARRSAVPCL